MNYTSGSVFPANVDARVDDLTLRPTPKIRLRGSEARPQSSVMTCDMDNGVDQNPPKRRRKKTAMQFGEYFTLKLVTLDTNFGYITKKGVYYIGCGTGHTPDSLKVIEKRFEEVHAGMVRPEMCNVEHRIKGLISMFSYLEKQ